MSPEKREKRFLELVRASKLADDAEIDRALGFQKFARSRGKPLAIDRILLKFEILSEVQIRSLYLALRYFTWRKEDKFYAKIAAQSQVLSPQDAARCLKEQKRFYKEKRVLKRLNEIAHEKGLLEPKEDEAIVEKMREVKPKYTIRALAEGSPDESSGGGRGPARKGEEEKWRRDVRARDLAELSNAARDPFASDDDDPLELDVDDDGVPQAKLSASGANLARNTDEDLDPLWDEADLDDIELDSGQAEAARGSMGSSSRSSPSDEDDTDLFS